MEIKTKTEPTAEEPKAAASDVAIYEAQGCANLQLDRFHFSDTFLVLRSQKDIDEFAALMEIVDIPTRSKVRELEGDDLLIYLASQRKKKNAIRNTSQSTDFAKPGTPVAQD